ncbi:CU044_2847 family protein [Streptomyces sp. NPDC047315]|uniref:CU044_2847 family protein n=1 Tax=Streptomyces sp. NPDC047315 TaxID=3155142 RepID=UPI0034115EB4
MSDVVQFALSDGTTVLVSAPARTGTGAVSLGQRLQGAQRTLREAIAPVTAAAAEMIAEFRSLAQQPEEVEVAFGITLDAQLGAVLTSAKTSVHLDVRLRWSSTQPDPPAPSPAPPSGGDLRGS